MPGGQKLFIGLKYIQNLPIRWNFGLNHQLVNWGLRYWAASIQAIFSSNSEANWLFEFLTSHVGQFLCVEMILYLCSTENSGFKERPPWRPHGQKLFSGLKYIQNLPIRWNFGLNRSTGAWDIERPPFLGVYMNNLHGGRMAKNCSVA